MDTHQLRNHPYKVAIASMVGTAIEFYDYYIYAAAAVLVFNTQFFDKSDPKIAIVLSLSSIALSFLARPIGSALFGHFGDKIGRKKTLVASLLTMGLSTVAIGLLPTYEQIGFWAALLLCLCRIGQGLGLGGEWGGAALVATENAPEGKRAWFGTFPQLGAPIGLFLANGIFFIISAIIGHEAMVQWGWRIPFLISIVLVFIGLWMRLSLHESHIFREAEAEGKTKEAPVKAVIITHYKPIIQGTFIMTATYVLFYIMTAFAQVYSKTPNTLSKAGHQLGLGIAANTFTGFLLLAAIVFGIFVSLSGICADKLGRRRLLLWISAAIALFGLSMPLFLTNGTTFSVFWFLIIGMALMGATFGPMAALLPELFPTEIRYSGSSLAYNLAAIVGASLATIITIELNAQYGMIAVGLYLTINAIVSMLALLSTHETKDADLTEVQ